jgi:histidine triad (HIT) family protein
MDCVFCDIVEKNDPYHEIVWQDDAHLAFLSIHPIREGHLLVIPKKHVDYLFDMEEVEYLALMKASKALAPALREAFGSRRIYLGVDGFQVSHTHVHLLPVNHSGDADGTHHIVETPDEMKAVGDRLREAFKDVPGVA